MEMSIGKENQTLGKPLSKYIDHTILKADCTLKEIEQLCSEAIENKFCAVCVPPYFVQHASRQVAGLGVKVATVVGFPMGYSSTASKVEEIKRAINDGADEIDVVVNINAIKNGDWSYVRNDIDSMANMTSMKNKLIKVIFEVELLDEEEMRTLCEICVDSGIDFVKTATGFNGKGNQAKTVAFLRSCLPDKTKIKASGGIRTQSQALRLIKAGADRLGCSKSIEIIKG